MRLFIAIELPKSFKSELSRIQRQVKLMSSGGKFVPGDSFHITLHFIGESTDLCGAVNAIKQAVRDIRPFELHLGKYDFFDNKEKKTSFVEVKGDLDELSVLYESLESALFDHGFSRERKKFTPHITLGRSVEHDDLVGGELRMLSPNASMKVNGIVLFESTRVDGRIVYTPIHKERF